jgi:hypothetical protein
MLSIRAGASRRRHTKTADHDQRKVVGWLGTAVALSRGHDRLHLQIRWQPACRLRPKKVDEALFTELFAECVERLDDAVAEKDERVSSPARATPRAASRRTSIILLRQADAAMSRQAYSGGWTVIATSAVRRVPLPREALMMRDPELSAILDQAARNLNNLELLVRTSGEDDLSAISPLRQRLEALQIAYRNETNVLTRQVLERAIERRVTTDRRRRAKMRTA